MTKKILITGKNSYIGNELADWLDKGPEKYEVIKESVRDDKWKTIDFSSFDVVVHVAGIAHIKETKENKNIYYKINRDLAFVIAKKAKLDGVKQFVFLSSMSVYGLENGTIDKYTSLKPTGAYGKSKIEAENLISSLLDDTFSVSILRPPMIYGKACKGNYSRLAKLALKTPIFPKVENQRSMIYIDNLSEFIKQLIDTRSQGLFFPQNADYVNTSEMVRLIAEIHEKKIYISRFFNPLLRLLSTKMFNKIFGNLTYEKEVFQNKTNYIVYDLKESILKTESRN